MYRVRGPDRSIAMQVNGDPVALLPWSLLSNKWRRRVVDDSDSVEALRMISDEVILFSRISGRAIEWLRACHERGELDTVLGSLPERSRSALVDLDVHHHLSWFGDRGHRAQSADVGPSEPSNRETPRTQPPAQTPNEIIAAFEQAAAEGAEIELHLKSDHVLHVRAERVMQAGHEQRLLGTDVHDERGRSIPIEQVRAVRR
jgi:hypothetical protein